MPTRFSGSAAEMVTASPEPGWRADARRDSTAIGQRKLLAQESADKAAAADFALIFEAAQGDEQFAPARGHRLARGHFAKDYAVAFQQRPADGFHHARSGRVTSLV